jgi:hypothetical protein
MSPIFPSDWEDLAVEDLARARGRLAELIGRLEEDSGTRKMLRALVTPLEAVQDAIIQLNEVLRK